MHATLLVGSATLAPYRRISVVAHTPELSRAADVTLPCPPPRPPPQLARGTVPDGGGQQPLAAAAHDAGRARPQDGSAARRQARGPPALRPAGACRCPAWVSLRQLAGHRPERGGLALCTARRRAAARQPLPCTNAVANSSNLQRDKFEDMLRRLTVERADICAAMAFAMDNAESGEQAPAPLTPEQPCAD